MSDLFFLITSFIEVVLGTTLMVAYIRTGDIQTGMLSLFVLIMALLTRPRGK